MEQLKLCIAEMGGFTSIIEERDRIQIHFPFGTANMEMINSHCFKNGITLQLLMSKKKSLESTFFELTND
jgi:ABC-2 type transport system ATP-binding protein